MKPPGAASRVSVRRCLTRNFVDSPTPILVAIAEQLGAVDRTGDADAAAACVMPRARIRSSHVDSVAGSKVRLLTTWVAWRRLSHMACTVRSSWIDGWDSG